MLRGILSCFDILAPVALLNYEGGCGHILLDSVWCDGSEDSILDCAHDSVSIEDCDHSTNAGVRCLNGKKPIEIVWWV